MDERIIPISGLKLVIATISVSLGTFLVALDQFIANVSIPTISGVLGVSQNDGSWVITSFTIASGIVIPLVGFLTTVFGQIRYFSISCVLFSIASLLCGLSTSFTMLIICRILQGVVSGALIPLSQTLLLNMYPEEKKGMALGFWGLVVMIGPAMGPVLGGWITEKYGWPWIFYINIPIGTMAGIVTYTLLGMYESERRKVPIDVIGIALIALGVGSLQVVLDKGQDLDWFSSYFIRTLTCICVISFSFLIPWEIFHKTPVINLNFFRSRNFTLGVICVCLAMMLVFGSFIIMPLWVQAQLGYTPYWAGLTLAPVGVLAIFVFPLVGIFQEKIDKRIWIGGAFILFAGTFWWYSQLYSQVTYWDIAFARLIQGIGFAFLFVPLTTITLTGITSDQYPSATSLYSFTRTLFISFGVSLSVTFWERRANFYHSRYAEFIIPSNPGYQPYYNILKNSLGLTGKKADAFVNQQVLNIQSYTMSLLDLCYFGIWMSLGLFVLLFFFRLSGKKNKPLVEKKTTENNAI